MFNAVVTGVVSGFIVLTGLIVAGYIVFKLAKRKAGQAIVNFITPAAAGQASAFALTVASVAGVFGAEIAQNLKAVFLGLQSVDNKNDRKAAAAGIIGGNSILGAIASSFPTIGKRLAKNPAMAALADLAVNRFAHQPAGDNGGRPAVKFDNF